MPLRKEHKKTAKEFRKAVKDMMKKYEKGELESAIVIYADDPTDRLYNFNTGGKSYNIKGMLLQAIEAIDMHKTFSLLDAFLKQYMPHIKSENPCAVKKR